MMVYLPTPDCNSGYTRSQLEKVILGPDRITELDKWIRGKVVIACDGSSCAQSHGPVVSSDDLIDFMSGTYVRHA